VVAVASNWGNTPATAFPIKLTGLTLMKEKLGTSLNSSFSDSSFYGWGGARGGKAILPGMTSRTGVPLFF
jgi:hypothetical protein